MRNRFIAGAACGVIALLAAASAAAQEEYLIGGGDVLQVNVWKNAELTQTVTVRPDGRITLPLVRDVQAAGLTAVELGAEVAERLAAFVNAPNVTITVAAANSFRVYTQGAVAAGMHVLDAPITARQLLSRVGGARPEADLGHAFLLRRGVRVAVDLRPAAGGGQPGRGEPRLVPGDVLVVPFREAMSGRVLVAGEVASPQALPFEEGMTFLDAFLLAGGATPAADLPGARVVRRGPTGGARGEIRVDVAALLARGDLSGNVALEPGDVLIVPRLPVRERVLVAGEVRTPLSLAYRDGLTVLDAFVEAGGATEYADLDSVKVLRHGEGGRVEIPANLDRLLGRGELGRNVDLAPGDVVVVPR